VQVEQLGNARLAGRRIVRRIAFLIATATSNSHFGIFDDFRMGLTTQGSR
jgi:hypothetical protein